MIINEKDILFIKGGAFDCGYELKLQNNEVLTRLELLNKLCKGKNVLHIGCCDHIPMIDEKVRRHEWLQGLLEETANNCIGIDIAEDAIEYIKKKGYSSNVYCMDITSNEYEKIPPLNYNCVVLGEILEHVDNPVEFLAKMKNNLRKFNFDTGGEIIITVPNLFKIQRIKWKKPIEIINSDHRYWFSPYTIAKVLYRSGITPCQILFADQEFSNWYIDKGLKKCFPKLRKTILRRKSYCGNTLIAIGRT